MRTAKSVPVSLPERRTATRHSRTLLVKWRMLGARDYRYAPTTLRDVSTTGLALLFEEAFPLGTVLIAQLEGVADKFAEPMLLRVEWSLQKKDKKWQVGCSFASPFSPEDLRALLESARKFVAPPAKPGNEKPAPAIIDPFLEGSAGERRLSFRRKSSSVAVFLSRSEGAREIEGAIVERSLSGLGIVVPAPFTRGTPLRVRIKHHHVTAIPVLVRNCRQQGKQWFLGCQFTQAPPANIIMLLG